MKRLYIGNLSWHITEEELRQFFSQAGTVISATIILHRDTGRSRGFGFVEMATEEEAQEAIKRFNTTWLKSRQLIVKEALPEGDNKDKINADLINFLNYAAVGQSYSFSFGNGSFTIFRDK